MRVFRLVFLCAGLLGASLAQADELLPFTSDGCSSFPNGTPKNKTLWLECCIRHDLAYWQGGTEQERLAADLTLEKCVATAGEPDIAKLMLQGVRAGGSPIFPMPYRWGYGWPFGRGYRPLTKQEKQQVAAKLAELTAMLEAARRALTTESSATEPAATDTGQD